jgi:ATP-dependent DNA helicase RecG
MAVMRPPILNPLFADAASLSGIGQKTGQALARLLRGPGTESARVIDLLLHAPRDVIDRRQRPLIRDLPPEGVVTIKARVGQHVMPPPFNKKVPYRVLVSDGTGALTLVFFHAFHDTVKRLLPEGEERFISGEVGWYNGEPQITHPDYVLSAEQFDRLPEIDAVYPLAEGLPRKTVARAAREALERLPALPEWLDEAWLKQNAWGSFADSLRALHLPLSAEALGSHAPARLRLAYDELLANQLALHVMRRNMKRKKGRELAGDGTIASKIMAALPYQLTTAQRDALEAIFADMASPERMLRLMQGDVGSGKTVVALLALARAIESGVQGALMAPTEILARQHHATLLQLAGTAALNIALLTGREKGKTRDAILAGVASGEVDLLIGTHALFQEGVIFADLGLAVIDEQHRFGVHQRLALQGKAEQPADLLVMTATPIPRTLALTVYGDMDVTQLREKPPGRQPIATRVLPAGRMDDIIAGLRRSSSAGQRAYWVCPLVGESEITDLAAAEERFKHLSALFPGRVGLLHGRLRPAQKDEVMASFKSGELDLLVATTVVEVGVDVTEATIMVIENAERFGLAQLHQLRGRVGRGSYPSSCVLLYQEPLGETAKARLSIMRETEDGFRIAEEDMRLRGPGEMLGTQQAGLPLFRIADLSAHGDLLAAARDDAELILNRDPDLSTARGQALRVLLYLFERDAAVRLLSSG